jgi:hypothetical protein
MKHILDASFRYKPSFDTDVRDTFERVRRELANSRGDRGDAGRNIGADIDRDRLLRRLERFELAPEERLGHEAVSPLHEA